MSQNNRSQKTTASQKRKDSQLSAIEAQITRAKLLLTRALKLAKAFERQKLGRRQKAADVSEEAQNGSRIVTEIQALKVHGRIHSILGEVQMLICYNDLLEY